MIIILMILLFILIIGSIILLLDYSIHVSMTKEHSNKFGKANYNIFIQEFNKYEWDTKSWSGSLFNHPSNSQIHASIIKFNGIGMIMKNPVEYLKMIIYVYKYVKNANDNKTSYVWKENI